MPDAQMPNGPPFIDFSVTKLLSNTAKKVQKKL